MTSLTLKSATRAELQALPNELKRLVVERTSPGLGLEGLEFIAAAPCRLTHLVYPKQELKGAKAGKLLATSPAFEHLEYLELGDNPLTDAFIKPFVTRTWRLKFLGLSSVKLGVDGLTQLAASRNFPALENLNLSADSRRELGLTVARLGDGNFPSLRRLNALGLVIGTEGFAALMGSKGLPKLEELQADGNLDIPALVATLPETLAMPLRRLGWTGTAKGDLPWERLKWLGHLDSLRMMHVLKERGFQSFLSRAPISNLIKLELNACDLGAEGAAMLTQIPFTRLKRLSIWRTQIFPDGAHTLTEAPWLAGLEGLKIDADQFGAAASEKLSQRTKLAVINPVLEESWYPVMIHEWPDEAPSAEAPSAASPPIPVPAPVPVSLLNTAAAEPEPASAKEAIPQILSALAGCMELFGPAKAGKDTLVYEGPGWKLGVVIKPAQLRVLESWERVGICLVVEAFVRVPAMERLLVPELSDKDYGKLPFKNDGKARPTLCVLISPESKHYWRLKDAGGPTRLARKIADQLELLAPVIVTPLALATRAAAQAIELATREPGLPGVTFMPTSCLAAAVGFLSAGDKARASEVMAAYDKHPSNANLSPNGAINGVPNVERAIVVDRIRALLS